MELTFFGASDDLLEVEGAIQDEFPAWEGTQILLVAPDKSYIEFALRWEDQDDVTWHFSHPTNVPEGWSFRPCAEPHPKYDYSHVVVVDAPEGTQIYTDTVACKQCHRPVASRELPKEKEGDELYFYCFRGRDCEREQLVMKLLTKE